MAKILRRGFLIAAGSMAALAATGTVWLRQQRSGAEIDRLAIDPDATEFVYRGGWIVPSDDVRNS